MSKHRRTVKPAQSRPRFHWKRRRIRIGIAVAIAAAGAAALVWAFTPSGKVEPNNPAQVAQGKAIYDRECAVCHGDRLQG